MERGKKEERAQNVKRKGQGGGRGMDREEEEEKTERTNRYG